MVTFKFNREYPICDGVDVIRDGRVVGFILCGGHFNNKGGETFSEEEQVVIRNMCKRVYEMPSEWGVLGVGESPTEPYDQFISKHPSWILFP